MNAAQLLETVTTRANPHIDPSLHVWGWEIVAYLFLGGLVAGLFVLGSALELSKAPGEPGSRWLRPMPFVALGLLSAGMLALWLDLAHRLWAWRFYAAFRPTSPMSWGAWLLVLIYPVGLLLGLAWLDASQRSWLAARTPRALHNLLETLTSWADGHRRPLLLTGLLVGAGLGVYTGLLLGTMPARPAWNSPVLGPLFLASGLSTAAALLLLLPLEERERHALVRWDLGAILAELALLALLLLGWSTSGQVGRSAAHAFLGGPYTAAFWSIVVVAGLLVPFTMELLESRRQPRLPQRLRVVALGPVLVLCGGLALRWILLAAGQESTLYLVESMR